MPDTVKGHLLLPLAATMMLSVTPSFAVVNEGAPSASVEIYDDSAAYAAAVAAVEAGRFIDAEATLNALIVRTPEDSNAQFLLGKTREGLGNVAGARVAYKAAADLDPRNLRAWMELGLIEARAGNMDVARGLLTQLRNQAIQCGASCSEAPASIERLEAAISGKSAALTNGHDMLFGSTKGGDQAYLAAVSLINQHRYEEALASLRETETAFGAHPDVLTYIGFVNRKLGRHDQAEHYYERALATAPEHRGATEYYGELKVVQGDMAGARQLLARLETLCPFGCAEADELSRWISAAHM